MFAIKHIKRNTGMNTLEVPKSGCRRISPTGTNISIAAFKKRISGCSLEERFRYLARYIIKSTLQNSDG